MDIPTDATVPIFKECFSTRQGKIVLGNLMIEAGFFRHNETPEEQAVENFVKTILCKCGIYDAGHIEEYITKLMSMRVDYGTNTDLE